MTFAARLLIMCMTLLVAIGIVFTRMEPELSDEQLITDFMFQIDPDDNKIDHIESIT